MFPSETSDLALAPFSDDPPPIRSASAEIHRLLTIRIGAGGGNPERNFRESIQLEGIQSMALKKKILIGYGIVFTLMGLVIAWAVVNLVSLGKASDAILRENYRSILAAENMVDNIERQDSGLLLLLMGDEKGITQFRANEGLFLTWLARAKDNITITGEGQLIRTIETEYADYRQRFSKLTDLRHSSGIPSPSAYYQDSLYPVFAKIREACIQLRNLNEEIMYGASLRADLLARRAIWSTCLVAAAAAAVALILSLVLAERIVKPVRGVMEALRRISAGDYGAQVPVDTADELGLLAGELNRMTDQLRHYHEMNIEQIIAEKKKGEAILSSIEDGLVVFDMHLKVTAINPAGLRILNPPFHRDADFSCADILPASRACELIRKLVDTGVMPDLPDEQRIITLKEAGRERHYMFAVTAVRGRERAISGIVLLLRDVTRLKEVERLKDEFITAASHELRTPLTSLGMSIDILQEHAAEGLAPKHRQLLQIAHEEVHRLKAMINELLDLSRIEAGRIELEMAIVSIQSLFDYVQDVFKSQLAMKGIALTSDSNADRISARADPNKITWVLSNLISNALRYVDRGGRIQLAARRIGAQVHVSVSDNGLGHPAGIPIEGFSEVCARKRAGVRGHRTGARHLQGNRPRPRRGDLGRIDRRPRQHVYVHIAGGLKGGNMDSKAILIIDDEKNIRLTMAQSLEPLKVPVKTAVNGEEGLQMLQAGGFSLVFLDLKLPGIEGLEVLRRMQEHWPEIRVIIITAHGSIASAVEAMKLGAVDFIQKPFSPSEIRNAALLVLEREKLDEKNVVDYRDLIELAKRHITNRSFGAAVETVHRAIAADPAQAEAYNLLGALLEIRGDAAEAQKFYRAALDIDPTFQPARANLERVTSWNKFGKIDLGSPKKAVAEDDPRHRQDDRKDEDHG